MKKLPALLKHRFGPVLLLTLIICSISFITRIVLLTKSFSNIGFLPIHFIGIFLVGLFYDLVVSSFFAIPVAIYCWLINDSFYRKKWQRIPLFTLYFILIFLIISIAGSEIVFWNEFNVRFNFIAVDYLVYTNEVLGNIQESYNMPVIILIVVTTTIILLFLIRKSLMASQAVSMAFKKRTAYFFIFLLIPVGAYFLVNTRIKNISNNNYVNELGGNGVYEFGAAFWNNELDYNRFYLTKKSSKNAIIITIEIITGML